ncbi:hypothetical protein EAX61_04810 [Dokdonia sinensis]|uniref:Lysine transporter LysE n=1 Tax=Dokdonia sinensis TaxID=2479847 RepID=A0A3M0GF27_9FLAO|nr:LysE family transporter [Dokdonia sinensis]RMB62898.1 hypothetical protein EAX61_04810 [Dokdonia sinensis]
MNIFIIVFLIGLLGAVLASLPPSATNLAVVKYTSKKTLSKALQLGYGAALGEVVVSGLAMVFGIFAQRIFREHLWIQISFIVLMGLAGIYFLRKKEKEASNNEDSSLPTRFISGLLLGALNIPMFIYWTAVFSVSSKYVILNENAPIKLIVLFLSGVFLGKYLILFLYGKLSNYMTENFASFKGKLNTIIGVVLILASIGQAIKLVID